MNEEPRYTYHYSQEYGAITLRMIQGSRGEYVEEVYLVGNEAEKLYVEFMRICPDYELRRVIAQQNQELRSIIEQYFNN